MSYGSISQEARGALAIAMNSFSGKSNAGKDGEDASRSPKHIADRDSNRTRFTSTPQNRVHHSDASRPSPSMSPHPLPHPVSRPSTSSHTNQQSALGVVSQQQVRRPHHDDSPSGSPDQPRLHQPEIRRVALLSPDLQLQSSPHHQNTDIYPSQATSKWASQQAMSSSAHHFRSSHTQPHPPAHLPEGAHFGLPRPFERYSEQLH
ncbi:hypothetical protein PCANC_21520 [Puccinia coronata f. sp. avenae]|uniref:Glutamate synthase domain-containing protein n=1 Tax=Puccinia coronata f. sp. avenae TaxID=200324 RepID=A0A2N5TND5_9BASI|nr:hypothetical protein PCANC_21520 [Puccinia coronata f. sp. avenae]